MECRAGLFAIALLIASTQEGATAATLLSADFNSSEDGFSYCADPFQTTLPDDAAGSHVDTGGFGGSGALLTTVGGVGISQTTGASGGWCYAMTLAAPANNVAISLRYSLQIDTGNILDEYSRLLLTLDGNLLGRGEKPYVDHLGGSSPYFSHLYYPETGWQQVTIPVGNLGAGLHQWQIGAYNNKSHAPNARTRLLIDDVVVTSDNPPPVASGPHLLVDRLDQRRFKANIQTLASFGDRHTATPGFIDAQAWVVSQLKQYGYHVEYHLSQDGSLPVSNIYVTKVGRLRPDLMYMVTAHLDGRGGGGAADDDGSGTSLVMEIARVLAATDVETDISVRMILWDDEEWGSAGSGNYVLDRGPLQGAEDPPGSGIYPEPTWLGMLQHDMLLYDHGDDPPGIAQSPFADMDVEWSFGGAKAAQSRELALTWHHWAGEYASIYPSTAYDESTHTDDYQFRNQVASVSVRENRRGISQEWVNPNWHAATDVYASYSTEDFELGFNAVQTTLGTVATLAGAEVDEIFRDGFEAAVGRTSPHSLSTSTVRGTGTAPNGR